ncbi:hypothetical protein ILYODFUR_033716 [Ilyodon furcidens]|uniref:Uncharacterized protein n=1 Tax=Ilyodon furcidens TaxID=33524 RepID=A0ABV0ULN6_9TELE
MPDFAPRSIWVIRIASLWRKVFYSCGLRSQTPVSSFGQESSWQLPVFPSSGPRHKRTLSTLQRKYLHPELLTVLRKSLKHHQRNVCVVRSNSDSDSLAPPPAVTLLLHSKLFL